MNWWLTGCLPVGSRSAIVMTAVLVSSIMVTWLVQCCFAAIVALKQHCTNQVTIIDETNTAVITIALLEPTGKQPVSHQFIAVKQETSGHYMAPPISAI